MRINELLESSQHLDEGPFTKTTQAIGKTFGKVAKGAAAVGKDLKTGFKAGYGSQDPAADAAATTDTPTTAPATTAAPAADAPVKKPAAPAQNKVEPAAPAATPPAEEPAAPAKDGGEVTKLKQQVASLTTDIQGLVQTMNVDKRDMLSDISNLKQQVSKLVKPSQSEIDADRARLMGVTSDSVIRKGSVMAESFSLYRKH